MPKSSFTTKKLSPSQRLDLANPWLSKIPHSSTSHGSGKFQQKFWKVVSDYVRIRDFYKYGGCISCSYRFMSWKESQAGHYKAWTVCKGYSKWDVINIFGQCSTCNSAYDGNSVGKRFGDGIISRYGAERLEFLEKFTFRPAEPLQDYFMVQKTKEIIELMAELPEQPDYYQKVIKAYATPN